MPWVGSASGGTVVTDAHNVLSSLALPSSHTLTPVASCVESVPLRTDLPLFLQPCVLPSIAFPKGPCLLLLCPEQSNFSFVCLQQCFRLHSLQGPRAYLSGCLRDPQSSPPTPYFRWIHFLLILGTRCLFDAWFANIVSALWVVFHFLGGFSCVSCNLSPGPSSCLSSLSTVWAAPLS